MTAHLPEIRGIIAASRAQGWVLEPEAKRIFAMSGFDVPRLSVSSSAEEAVRFARVIGYPVVAKVVSPRILHKSDVKGVAVGIDTDEGLAAAFRRFQVLDGFLGMIVEEQAAGIELILGAKNDVQFGPLVLLGMGGTGVEIYKDVSLKMAPISKNDAEAMIQGLKARRLLEGYRGGESADLARLTATLLAFSSLVMELEEVVESIDINPLLCSSSRCVVADARIILCKE